MFSFHVHEKQILLPLLIFGILIHDFRHYFTIMVTVGNFSLAKLYCMDLNKVSIVPLTILLHFLGKKLDAVMINDFKIPEKEISLLVYDEDYKI